MIFMKVSNDPVFDLKLHEARSFKTKDQHGVDIDVSVLRVSGGYIYKTGYRAEPVFVPYSNELQYVNEYPRNVTTEEETK